MKETKGVGLVGGVAFVEVGLRRCVEVGFSIGISMFYLLQRRIYGMQAMMNEDNHLIL